MRYRITALAALAAGALIAGTAAAETRLLRMPDIGTHKIVFVYAGDIWSVARDGSDPRRLTVGAGVDRDPHFSPDGERIAFTRERGGNTDVYVMPATGGQPERLTYHPGEDRVRGWSRDGERVLFTSPRKLAYQRGGHLFTVDIDGGLPERLPMPVAWDGSYGPDGQRIAYQPYPSGYSGNAGWKQYRGGRTPPIWLFDLAGHEIERIPNDGVNDAHPMWLDDTVYFVSDRDGAANLYAYTPGEGEVRQLTDHDEWGIRWAAAADGAVVYELGGRLHRFDIDHEQSMTLSIELDAALPAAQPRWVKGAEYIRGAGLSPSGKRAIFNARGDIFTVPADKGSIRNLTESSGAHEQYPLWSPDGKRVAYLSDASGEYRLMIEPRHGRDEARAIDLANAPAYYRLRAWSPDGETIIYEDNHLNLYALDVEEGASRRIDTHAMRWPPWGFAVDVSPDSRWLAYTKVLDNYMRALMLYDLEAGERIQVTHGMSGVSSPVFGREGKYLFFAASTNIGPATAWLDMSNQERPVRRGLYAAVLSAEDETPVPLQSDDAKVSDDAGDNDTDGKKEKDGKSDQPPKTRVDAEGIDQRIIALPVAKRDYARLVVAGDGSLIYSSAPLGAGVERPPKQKGAAESTLHRFDFKARKEFVVRDKLVQFRVSSDGSKLLVQTGGSAWRIIDTPDKKGGKQGKKGKGKLKLAGMKLHIDPREEWRQIFEEAWRFERDFFYDPGMHGADWDAVKQRYGALVEHVGRREALNYVLLNMVAELESGHAYVAGGDTASDNDDPPVGLLGADLAPADDAIRFERVYTGESWNPFLEAPLAVPGKRVAAGDYLLAIDGKRVRAGENPYRYLQGKVGEQITLTVNDTPESEGAREITVRAVKGERELRRWAWIEDNRRRVAEMTDGRVGYVYLPNTAQAGYRYFNRYFYSQLDKEALIIDERGNSGGQAANYIVDQLTRTYLGSWQQRDGKRFTTPVGAVFGPKVMLIDQFAGSGGDFLPYAFRRQGNGTLIGQRTWGGLIGIGIAPPLIDGGFVTAPYFRFIHPDGHWAIENEGVAPDIAVERTPKAVIAGRQPQLEKAVEVVLDKLREHEPVTVQQAPPYPDKARR